MPSNQVATRNSIINQFLENTDLYLLSISQKLKLSYTTVRRVILNFQNEKLQQERVVRTKRLAHDIQKKL